MSQRKSTIYISESEFFFKKSDVSSIQAMITAV